MLTSLPLLPSLLSLCCLLGLAVGAARQRWQVVLLASLGSLGLVLSVLYAGIDQLTGNGLNAAVFYHLEQDTDGAGVGEFAGLLGSMCALLLLAGITLWWCIRRGRRHQRPRLTWPALLVGLAAFSIHPLSSDVLELVTQQPVVTGALTEHFVAPPETLEPARRHNLVYLYLESLEGTYFDGSRFPELAPNLTRWAAQAEHFTAIRQVWGTEWTIAGMVASQCGMPLVTTGSLGNTMHSTGRFLPGATCLGDQLVEAGYSTAYVGGAKLGFAGKGTFYSSHGVPDQTGLERILEERGADTPTHRWGVHDDVMLETFRQRFDALAAAEAPFALFGLTLDTHHPVGHLSPSCALAFPESLGDPMLDVVRCTDWLVQQVVQHIEASAVANETILVLASDHLAMPNSVSDVLKAGPRHNFLAIKVPGRAPARIDRPGSTMDIAALLANSLDPSIDAYGLGRNLRTRASITAGGRLGDKALSAYVPELRRFWQLPDALERMVFRDGTLHAGANTFEAPVAIALDPDGGVEALLFGDRKSITWAELDGRRGILLDRCAAVAVDGHPTLPAKDWCILLQDPQANVRLGAPLPPGPLRFTDGFEGLLDDAGKLGLRPAQVYDQGRLWSQGGWIRRSGYVHPIDPTEHVYGERGLNLFRLDGSTASPELVQAVDTCALGSVEGAQVPRFADTIAAQGRPRDVYVVVAHDSVICEGENLAPRVLEGLPFDPTAIAYRAAFIGALRGDGRKLFEAASLREGNVIVRPQDLLMAAQAVDNHGGGS